MNKSEIVKAIAESADISLKAADMAANAFMEAITDALKNGDKVNFTGWGSFEVRERAARDGRNPRTGEVIRIKASKIPSFKAGKLLKDAVQDA